MYFQREGKKSLHETNTLESNYQVFRGTVHSVQTTEFLSIENMCRISVFLKGDVPNRKSSQVVSIKGFSRLIYTLLSCNEHPCSNTQDFFSRGLPKQLCLHLCFPYNNDVFSFPQFRTSVLGNTQVDWLFLLFSFYCIP